MTVNLKTQGEMDRILKDPFKCISEVRGIGGILAGLWRRTLHGLVIGPGQFEILLNDFIIKAKKRIPDNRVAKLFTRGNLRREFEKKEMTFKVFVKGLKVLKMKHLKITLELTTNSGKHYVLDHSIDLSSSVEMFDGDEDDQNIEEVIDDKKVDFK